MALGSAIRKLIVWIIQKASPATQGLARWCAISLASRLRKNGLGTRYGFGVDVLQELGLRAIEHGGDVSGFTAQNLVFPDARVAGID